MTSPETSTPLTPLWPSTPLNIKNGPPPSSDPPTDWDWMVKVAWGVCEWNDVPEAVREGCSEPEDLDLFTVFCRKCDVKGSTEGKGLRFVVARGGGHVSVGFQVPSDAKLCPACYRELDWRARTKGLCRPSVQKDRDGPGTLGYVEKAQRICECACGCCASYLEVYDWRTAPTDRKRTVSDWRFLAPQCEADDTSCATRAGGTPPSPTTTARWPRGASASPSAAASAAFAARASPPRTSAPMAR